MRTSIDAELLCGTYCDYERQRNSIAAEHQCT